MWLDGSMSRGRAAPRVKIFCRELQEHRPIRSGRVAGRMLPKRDVAGHEGRFNLWKFGRTNIFLSEQAVDGPGAHAGQERALRIDPRIVDVCGLLLDGAAAGLEARITRLHHLDCAIGVQVRTVAGAEEYRARCD